MPDTIGWASGLNTNHNNIFRVLIDVKVTKKAVSFQNHKFVALSGTETANPGLGIAFSAKIGSETCVDIFLFPF